MAEDNKEVKPQTEKERLEEFHGKYQKLCKEYNVDLVAKPNFKPTNHGTYEIEAELLVIPKK